MTMTYYEANQPLIALIVVLPILVAIFLNLFHRRSVFTKWLSVATAALLIVITLACGYGYHWFTGHPIFAGFRLALEYLFGPYHKLAVFIMSLILLFVVLAANLDVRRISGVHLAMLMLCFSATAMAVMVNDLYHLWIAVEVASLIVAGIVAVSGEPGSHRAALKYTFLAGLAGAGLAVSLAILLGITGASNITDAINVLKTMNIADFSITMYVAYAFFVFAWVYVGGMVPIHPIKADVYRYSLPHAAVLLQTQAKLMLVAVGLIILRLFGFLPYAREAMLVLSIITAVTGVVLALLQEDFRHVLAYLVVSHGGLVGIGISLGTPYALSAGIFQAINDILYMSLLFLVCEALLIQLGRAPTSTLGGLASQMPKLTVFAILGGLAASGVPPFNGFQSELMLINASLKANLPEVAVVILLVSITTFIAIFKSIYTIFLRPAAQPIKSEGEPSSHLLVALFVLTVICLLCGVVPQLPLSFISPIALEVGLAWP